MYDFPVEAEDMGPYAPLETDRGGYQLHALYKQIVELRKQVDLLNDRLLEIEWKFNS